MAGFVKLHRQILDSRVFSDPKLLKIWVWCLCKANHAPGWFQGEEVTEGQFVTGRISAASELEMSESAFYRGIQKLQEWGQISLTPNNRWTTITICNWTTYQSRQHIERTTDEQQMDNERTTDEQLADTNKNNNNNKNDKNEEKEDGVEPLNDSPLELPDDEILMVFPCVGGQRTWPLVQSKLDEWAETFPGVDVMAECRKALQWCRDNPQRQKTAGGMTKYINTWLSKAQNDSAKFGAGVSRGSNGKSGSELLYEAKTGKGLFDD